MRTARQLLTGWGRVNPHESRVWRPEKAGQLDAVLKAGLCNDRGFIPRGKGRSYGDAAVQGGAVLSEKLDKFLGFDAESGLLRAQSGVTVADILENFLHRGWILPVMPGTKHVTLGGCLASDVHGKDHRAGTFGHHVQDFTIRTARGERLRCSRTENKQLFHATLGGMGLTGFVEEMTVRLHKINSSRMAVKTLPFPNLARCLELLQAYDTKAPFVAAWLDVMHPECRGWLQIARPHDDGVFKAYLPEDELSTAGKLFGLVSNFVPSWVLNGASIRLFNLYISKKSPHENWKFLELPDLFFPLDGVPAWNKLYGSPGFYQFQCVLPRTQNAQNALAQMIKIVREAGIGSFFTTLKIFSKKPSEGLLSFPMEGMTLAMDFPHSEAAIRVYQKLVALTIQQGGRVYLAKDALMNTEQFQQMYPNWQAFMDIKRTYDPSIKIRSQLYKRLIPQQLEEFMG